MSRPVPSTAARRRVRRRATIGLIGAVLGVTAHPAVAGAAGPPLPAPTAATAVISGATSPLADVHWFGDAGATAPARALVALAHRDQAGLLRFIAAVSDPRRPSYGHYLTSAQFRDRYAPTSATVAAVERYLTGAGLRVAAVPSNRAYVLVTGDVTEMNRAFSTRIASYMRAGDLFQAPRTPLRLPDGLARLVTGVDGLDTGDLAHPLTRCITTAPATPATSPGDPTKTPATPAFVNAPPFSTSFDSCPATQAPGFGGTPVLGDAVRGYTPAQIQGAYGLAPAIRAGLNGSGVTVAVIDAYSSPTMRADAAEYARRNGLPAPNLTINDNAAEQSAPEGPSLPTDVPILGGANLQDPSGWFGEESLDVEAVHTTAPGARIIVQGALSPQTVDLEQAQNAVVSANVAKEISNSYGGAGGGPDSTDSTSDGYWQQAAAQGQGVEFSSGDNGDNTTGGTMPANAGLDGDANSPYVTSVGGTTLAVRADDTYGWETYWGERTATLSGGKWGPLSWDGGGGGGVSQAYAEPAYQKGVVPDTIADYWKGNPNASTDSATSSAAVTPGRTAPDISMLGDPNSGFLMGQTQDFSVNANPGNVPLPIDGEAYAQYRIGGTSLSSPLFAGVMALADQAAGKPLGFHNPALYGLERTAPRAFHDPSVKAPVPGVVRTNYDNSTDASGGTTTVLRTFDTLGTLVARRGYDDSTGLGTPNGLTFLCALAPRSAALARLGGAPCAATHRRTVHHPRRHGPGRHGPGRRARQPAARERRSP